MSRVFRISFIGVSSSFIVEFFSMNRTVSEFLRNPCGSSFESAINLSVNRVVGKSSVENPENILISKIFLY